MAEGEHAGDRRRGVQVDTLADRVAKGACVIHQPRGAGQVLRTAGLGQPLGEPDPQVLRTAAAVAARLQSAQQGAGPQHGDSHPARRGDEDQEPDHDPPPVRRRRPGHQLDGAATLFSIASQITHCRPVSVASGTDERHLRQLGEPRCRCHVAALHLRRRGQLVEVAGQRSEPGMVVQVGDGHLGIRLGPR